MKHTVGLAVFALALTMAAAAPRAQARTLNQVLSAGELRVGVNPNYPPSAMYNDKNQLVGFEVDVARRLAEMLGVKVHFVIVSPASRIPFVVANKIDLVMGGMTRTPARAKVISFSVPINTEVPGVLTTDAAPYQSLEQMNTPAVTFAEVRGTTDIPLLQRWVPKAKILFLENLADTVRAVADGRATAIMDDSAFFSSTLLDQFPSVKWKTLKHTVGPVYYDCLGLAMDNDALRRWVNVALFQLETSGFVEKDWEKWHHAPMLVPVAAQPYF